MIPKKLNDILKLAEDSLKENEDGALILPIRKKIWKLYGEHKSTNNSKNEIVVGQKRRVKLASLCVYKVLNIWKNNVKNDDRPEILLEQANDYIEGKCDIKFLDNANDDFYADLECISSEENDCIIAVGNAVFDTVIKAMVDECLLVDRTEDELDDDLDCWDASYESADAYAGGGKWQEKSSPQKRREFWLWYIKEAVPQAYLAYQD